jgi:hypothetical protein
VRRALFAGIIGALLLGSLAAAPAAGASSGHPSTTCTMRGTLRYRPALNHGRTDFAFFTIHLTLSDCVGGGVSSATGKGGAEGSLTCRDGVVTGTAPVKAAFDWDTGDRTAINAFINFNRGRLTHGAVVSGLFLDDPVTGSFDVRPIEGDCDSAPLVRSRIVGSIGL